MEETKKLLLIDPQSLSRLQTSAPATHSLNDLDESMKSILAMGHLNDRDKWTLYNQQLQKYLFKLEETRKPVEIPLREEKSLESQPIDTKPVDTKPDIRETVITLIPKKYRVKAGALYDFMTRSHVLGWNERGVLSINGEFISGSNVTDLIGDMMRELKDSQPIGVTEFMRVLKQMHVPKEVISNKLRWKQLNDMRQQEGHGSGFSSPLSQPVRPRSRQSHSVGRIVRWERIRL